MPRCDCDVSACRTILKDVMVDVRKHTTVTQRGVASTYRTSFGDYSFYGPGDFIMHSASQCCAYAARANGWSQYLEDQGIAVEVGRDAS